ncbi:hypothetical protein STENM223S_06716 [Streptomyces tendae]
MLEGNGADDPTGSEWLKGTVGVSLYVALLGLLSLAVGSIIRHSAGAITIMVGGLLAPLVIALFMFSASLKDVQQALFEYSIPNQMSIFYANSLSESGPVGLGSAVDPAGRDRRRARRRLRPAGASGTCEAARPGARRRDPQNLGALRDRCTRVVRRSFAFQHALCQCRRSSTPACSGQATTCGTPSGMSWSHPGQRYDFPCALAPATCRTLQLLALPALRGLPAAVAPGRPSSALGPDGPAPLGRLRRGDTGHLTELYRKHVRLPAYAARTG